MSLNSALDWSRVAEQLIRTSVLFVKRDHLGLLVSRRVLQWKSSSVALDNRRLPAYTSTVTRERSKPAVTPCLCNALRQASRAVTRLYDEELRSVGLRTTQYSLLSRLSRVGKIRQRDLGGLTSLDETTLTRNLRPLIDAGWVATGAGDDRREKLVRLTEAGAAKLREAQPAWERGQERMQSRMPGGALSGLLASLTDLARRAEDA
jgi:DNA-binding MarR family transcriptional regulator